MTPSLPVTASMAAKLQETQESGAVHLHTITEAEYTAAGFPAPSRAADPNWLGDEVAREGGARSLCARGFATRQQSALGALTLAGDLESQFVLAGHPQTRLGLFVTFATPEAADSSRRSFRISVLTDLTKLGVALVERLNVPVQARADQSLSVSVDLVRLDVLSDQLAAEAFRGAASAGEAGTSGSVLSNLGFGAPVIPSRLEYDWASRTARLTALRKRRLSSKLQTDIVDRDAYVWHVRERLLHG